MNVIKPFLVSFICITLLIDLGLCTCSWGSWSRNLQCEWIENQCLKGYRRYCYCDKKISMGSACFGNVLTNFIQTKPFVSNFYSAKGNCYKEHCSLLSNWCDWKEWSHWNPLTNTSCHRNRKRMCCNSHTNIGYTSKKSLNYGCFVSRSMQNTSQMEEETKNMQCSPHTWWLRILFYVGISLGILIILCIICRFTGSNFESKVKYPENVNELSMVNTAPKIEPSAPKNEPSTPKNEPSAPLAVATQSDASRTLLIPNTDYPSTPPTYDETIRASLADSANENSRNEFNEKKNFPDLIENTSLMNEERTDINVSNIPPPTYAIYSRNPNLFHPST